MTKETKRYDVAAYVWPAFRDAPEMRWAFPEGMGEWERLRQARPKFEGHQTMGKPLWGYCNEEDRYVMEMQINAAADHGVNVFIYDWYWYDRRPFLEGCLNEGYLKARNNDRVKFYLMWANHNVGYGWDIRNSSDLETVLYRGAIGRLEFEEMARYAMEKHFSQPSYYRLDNKPVFCIYDIDGFVNGCGGIDEAAEALEWFRGEAVKAGLPGLHLQAVLRGTTRNLSGVDGNATVTQSDAVQRLGFDSITHYQFCHFLPVGNTFETVMELAVKEWERLGNEYEIPYFPHVSVGWDSNARFKALRPAILTENDPARFRAGLEQLKAYVDSRPDLYPLITLNAWNEWTESCSLEPTDKHGYGYLEAVRDVFGASS